MYANIISCGYVHFPSLIQCTIMPSRGVKGGMSSNLILLLTFSFLKTLVVIWTMNSPTWRHYDKQPTGVRAPDDPYWNRPLFLSKLRERPTVYKKSLYYSNQLLTLVRIRMKIRVDCFSANCGGNSAGAPSPDNLLSPLSKQRLTSRTQTSARRVEMHLSMETESGWRSIAICSDTEFGIR